MSLQIMKEKLNQAVEILNEKNIDMWMTFVRESSVIKDPSIDLVVGMNATWQSAFIINKDGEKTAIVGEMEIENVERLGLYDKKIGYLKSIRGPLLNYLADKKPANIAINYSVNSNLADGLTHGMYLILKEHLKGSGFEGRLISSEEIVSALRGRKSPAEILIMREAAEETLKIFESVSKFIKPGKTEIEIATFIKDIVNEKGFELAWDEDHCPAVFTGPEAGSAHSGPTNRKVEPGHLVNIDFGIKHKGYCSDIQRTWYVLRNDETNAPAEVKKGFEIIRDAIQMVADNLKPDVQGCEMDDIARNYITQQGYDEYPHGLGHQLGRSVHDGGAGLFPRWEKYGNTPFMPVEEGQVFTIEPRLFVKGFGTSTLEEEVVVTSSGSEFITNPQKELWLIR